MTWNNYSLSRPIHCLIPHACWLCQSFIRSRETDRPNWGYCGATAENPDAPLLTGVDKLKTVLFSDLCPKFKRRETGDRCPECNGPDLRQKPVFGRYRPGSSVICRDCGTVIQVWGYYKLAPNPNERGTPLNLSQRVPEDAKTDP